VSYTFQISNRGPSNAPDVIVRDTLPRGLSFVADTDGACAAAGRAVTCALGTLNVGASRELGVDVRVDRSLAGRTVRNTATIASEPSDPTLSPAEVVPSSNFDADDLVIAPLESEPSPPISAPPPTSAPRKHVPARVVTECRSKRRFTIRLRERRGRAVKTATVRVNGRRVATLRRRSDRRMVAVIDLRGLPRGTYRVEITARLRNGRRARWVRSYRTCMRELPPSNRLGNPRAL
jgi:hypothetical protein